MNLTLTLSTDRYFQAIYDTLTMVSVSAGVALLLGIPLAVLLIVTAPNGFVPAPRLNRTVGYFININII